MTHAHEKNTQISSGLKLFGIINLSFGASVSGVDSSSLVIAIEPTSPEEVDARGSHVRIRHGASVVRPQSPVQKLVR